MTDEVTRQPPPRPPPPLILITPKPSTSNDDRTSNKERTTQDVTNPRGTIADDKSFDENRSRLYPQIVTDPGDFSLNESSESSNSQDEDSTFEGSCSDQGSTGDLDVERAESASLCGAGKCPNCGDILYQSTNLSVSKIACERCGKLSTTTYDDDLSAFKVKVDTLESLQRADHVAWRRSAGAYWHHGIVEEVEGVTGQLLVINYNGEPVKRDGHYASVRREWVSCNLRKKNLYRFHYDPEKCFPPKIVIERAMSRLGEAKYNPFTENCEHFARWCKTGQHRSIQVETLPQRIRDVPDNLSKGISKDKAFDVAARTAGKGFRMGEKLVRKGARTVFTKIGSALATKAPDVVDFVDRTSDRLVNGLTKAENLSDGLTGKRKALEKTGSQPQEPKVII